MSAMSIMDLIAATVAALTAPQATDCREISDPAARLACYDSREVRSPVPSSPPVQAPVAPVAPPMPAGPARAPTASTPAPAAPAAKRASSASIIRADPEGRVASVAPLRYGLYRVTLDDGRAFDTATNLQRPPEVGATVRLRRTPIGTTFLDTPGRDPITVRLVRRAR